MSDILDTLWKERNDLQERVEELEGERTHLNERLGWTDEEWKKKHLISHEMIDAAWAYAKDYEPYSASCLEALEIKRCWGCAGGGRVRDPMDRGIRTIGELCPDCDGHGWVIGGEK